MIRKRTHLILMLVLIALFSALMVSTAMADYTSKVDAFINNDNWKHWTWWDGGQHPKVDGNSEIWGCAAYAYDFANQVWGVSSYKSGPDFWSDAEIQDGDVVHIRTFKGYNDDGEEVYDTHFYVVLDVRNDGTFLTAEGNVKYFFDDHYEYHVVISDDRYSRSNTHPGYAEFGFGYHNPYYEPYAPEPEPYYLDMTAAKQTYLMLADCPNSVLAVNPANNNVQLEAMADTATQFWSFEKQDDESYIITSLYNGYVLDVDGAYTSDGTNVQVYPRSSGVNNAQRWYVILGNGGNYFKPKNAPDKRMDAAGGNTAPGTNIQIYTYNKSSAQRYSAYYQNDKILPTGLSLGENTNIELTLGQTADLVAEFTPWNTGKKGLTWKSSNTSVATVNSSGRITAVGEGTATITATSTFNTTISASRRVVVASSVAKPQITELNVSGRTVHLSWTASPLVGNNDARAYEVVVRNTDSSDPDSIITYRNITDTSYDFSVAAHGRYSVQVTAINTRNGSSSNSNSRSFIALDEEWMDFRRLPPYMPEDYDIQYVNHYSNKQQQESPGEGWVIGASLTTYQDGNIIYSPDRRTTSDTLVEIGTYYFHFCDGSGEVERFWTDRFCNETKLDNNGEFDIVNEYDDSNPNYKVYRLRWNSGEWAGGLATCPYGYSDALALYYIGYRYQERTAITTYIWTKADTISYERDPNADSVTYRVREAMTYQNRLLIPAGVKRIEAQTFMNDTTIQEVVIPDDCEYIGSKAFSGCTGLRKVHVPRKTQIEGDAFEGCTEYVIIRTGE